MSLYFIDDRCGGPHATGCECQMCRIERAYNDALVRHMLQLVGARWCPFHFGACVGPCEPDADT